MPRKKRTSNEKKENSLTIVGIGASAGGLSALKTFFKHVPENSNLAFVVVVHLSPEHKSHLADLLQPYVKMPVEQVTKTIQLEANHVYLIPPGRNLNSIDTHLRLSDLEEHRRERAPIDHFFRTLAKTHDGHAVGIILTGTGSDGTLGIKEIKGQGGLVIVQDPYEAEYDGMPQSAISTGMADLILPLIEIPQHIVRFAHTEPQVVVPKEGEELEGDQVQLLQKIFAQIRTHTGRDFSRYKRSTILRRIQRRMQLYQMEELEKYLNLLREKPEEVQALSDEFLITVTSFFRDQEVFAHLTAEVIPLLFKDRSEDEKVRVWSVGCATGEEAYSLAMLLLEEAAKHKTPPEIQVFASDLHEHSLQKARDGFYPGDIETDVSPERLKRFFVKEEGGFRIRKEVRELVVFAPHNLLADPPFSKLDLIVCRNLLIYLQRDVQRDVMEIFHYALKPEGFLSLGTSESIESSELFHMEHKGYCLYRKRNVQAQEPRLPVFPLTQIRMRESRKKDEQQEESASIPYGMLHQRIVERYAPPSLLVSPDYNVVHLSEHVGRYLAHPGGEFTANVFKLVRKEFHLELRSSLHTAREKELSTQSKPISLKIDGEFRWVVLSVYPAEEKLQKGFAVVLFDEREVPSGYKKAKNISLDTPGSGNQDEDTVQALQKELDQTKQQLQAIIEEYETSQEEMKASNEEMQSTNEELRSTLEELETSKEELQSMNEELTTVNQENRHKVEELSQLSNDLHNLLASTDIATLYLDRQFRILRFTPRVGELFNVRLTDRGRPLSDYTHRLVYDEIQSDAKKVLDKLIPIEREVQDEENRWYLTRVLPYRSTDDHIEGVVITFVDITGRKETEENLRESEERYRTLFDSIDEGFCIVEMLFDPSGKPIDYRFLGANPAFEGETGLHNAVGKRMRELEPSHEEYWFEIYGRIALTGEPERFTKEAKYLNRWFDVYAFRVNSPEQRNVAIIFKDVTASKRTEETLRQNREHLRLIMESATDYAIITFDTARNITDWNTGAELMLGYKKEEIVGKEGNIIYTDEDKKSDELKKVMKAATEQGRIEHNRWYVRKDGSRFWGSGTMMPLREKGNALRGFLKIITDDTERRRVEEALKKAKKQAEQAAKAKEDFLAHMSHEIRTPLNAIIGLSNLLLQQAPQPSQRDNLNTLKFSAENLRMLINDILDFSKIQAGKITLEETDVKLRELLHSLQKAHEPRAKEWGNALKFHIDEKIPEVVYTDQLKLSQVLHNLVSNALKFTRQGMVQVAVSLNRKKGKQLWVDFSVRDTGIGIPEDKLSQIFDAFTQASVTKAQPYEGTGLGLSITKLLLAFMNSQIEVESKEGEGSRFYFTLPMKEGTATAYKTDNPSLPQEAQAKIQNLKMLLVEDMDINRKIIMQFLEEWWQLVPDEAADGRQAVDLAKKKHYDLILMDVRMPEMNGYEATKAIRALPGKHYQQVPIIALTADTVHEMEKHSEASLFADILTKPFDPGELQEKIMLHAPKAKKQQSKSTAKGKAGTKGKQSEGNGNSKGHSRKKAPTTAYGINIQKIKSFLSDDTKSIEQFLKEVLKEFSDFQQKFTTAMDERDEKALSDLKHKKTLVIDLLNLKELATLLEQSQALLKENAKKDQIEEAKQQFETIMEQVSVSIQKYLDDIK